MTPLSLARAWANSMPTRRQFLRIKNWRCRDGDWYGDRAEFGTSPEAFGTTVRIFWVYSAGPGIPVARPLIRPLAFFDYGRTPAEPAAG